MVLVSDHCLGHLGHSHLERFLKWEGETQYVRKTVHSYSPRVHRLEKQDRLRMTERCTGTALEEAEFQAEF